MDYFDGLKYIFRINISIEHKIENHEFQLKPIHRLETIIFHIAQNGSEWSYSLLNLCEIFEPMEKEQKKKKIPRQK